jgi:hypothetical protein
LIATCTILVATMLAPAAVAAEAPAPAPAATAVAPTGSTPAATATAVPVATAESPPPPGRSTLPGRGPDPAPTPVADETPPDDPSPPELATSQPAPPPEAAPAPAPVHVRRRSQRPPRPIRWRIDPFLDLGTMRTTDPGYRALDDGPNLVQFGAGVRVDARVRGPLFLGGGLRYGLARGTGFPYRGQLSTDITMHEPRALLRASVVLLEGLDVVAQLEGGAAFASTWVDAYTESNSYDASYSSGRARDVLGVFDAKAGLSLYLPKQWLAARGAARVTAGFEFLLGYGYRSRYDVRPKRDDYGESGIRVVGADLGDVAVRGLVWSTGLFVRFM